VGVHPPVLELDALVDAADVDAADVDEVDALVVLLDVLVVSLVVAVVLELGLLELPPLPPALVVTLDPLVSSSSMSEVEPVAQAPTIPTPTMKRNE